MPALISQRLALGEIGEVWLRTGVVGGKKAARCEAVIEFAQQRGAGHHILVWIVRIGAKPEASAQHRPGIGHDLHQTHGAAAREGACIARAFHRDHGAYQVCGARNAANASAMA